MGTPDLLIFWSWFLLFTRTGAMLLSLPGIGTDEIPHSARGALAVVLSSVLAFSGVSAEAPTTVAEGGLMIITEFILGYLIGALPAFVLAGLSVAGQINSTAIGLGQANLIDPTLGEHVSALSRLQLLIGTVLFLLFDGHHLMIRAVASPGVGLGMFRPGVDTADLLVDRFVATFQFAVTLTGPILVTILITNCVLGIITKFVPQMNIFIISLPLTIGIGLFLFQVTLPDLIQLVGAEFSQLDRLAARLMGPS